MSRKIIKLFLAILFLSSLVAILAPLAIRKRIKYGSEWSPVDTLRNLHIYQCKLRKNVFIDQDQDGIGEYGLLNELTGLTKLRGNHNIQRPPITFFSSQLPKFSADGYCVLHGYFFRIFLPHKNQVIVDSKEALNGSADNDSINAQEKQWIAYAWPISESCGQSCYVINESGELFYSIDVYIGKEKIPAYNAAMDKNKYQNSLIWGPIAANNKNTSIDGLLWVSVKK